MKEEEEDDGNGGGELIGPPLMAEEVVKNTPRHMLMSTESEMEAMVSALTHVVASGGGGGSGDQFRYENDGFGLFGAPPFLQQHNQYRHVDFLLSQQAAARPSPSPLAAQG
ncbi:unnamed protein product [Linum tenue]|nr:unnamed protein product [Linum tenue]